MYRLNADPIHVVVLISDCRDTATTETHFPTLPETGKPRADFMYNSIWPKSSDIFA